MSIHRAVTNAKGERGDVSLAVGVNRLVVLRD